MLLWLTQPSDVGRDIVTDGEQSRQHLVHGFLEQAEGIDFAHKVRMGIRNNRYEAMVPQVVGMLALRGPVHRAEAAGCRAHALRRLKSTLPGPMTSVRWLTVTMATGHVWPSPSPICWTGKRARSPPRGR